MKPFCVYLCEYIHPAARAALEAQAEILTEPEQLPLADAAINRNLKMDRAWLERCPNLKVIGIHGTGTDGVDLEAARQRGIRVVYAPGENARSVAELIVADALLLYRQIPRFDRMLRGGMSVVSGGGEIVGRELRGKVFGTVGCGNVARQAVKILTSGFGMRAVGCSPSLTPEKATQLGIDFAAGPEEVFRRADVISISVPLNNSTRNLVNAALLARAKPGAILINTARGGVVNEDDLYHALTSGTLAAAASDVFLREPPTAANRLLGLPNFLATPHIGANTEEALYRVSNCAVSQVLAVLNGTASDEIHFVV